MRSNLYISFTSLMSVCASTAFAAPPAYIVKDLGTLSGANEAFEPGTIGLAASTAAIVGSSVTTLPNREFHAFRVVGDTMQDLGVLVGDEHSMAFGVNNSGDAVGVSYALGQLTYHGVLWSAAGATTSLGDVEPRDINESGAIAASTLVVAAPGTTHATLIVGRVSTDLGTLGGPTSMGLALNADNWVVGQSLLADGQKLHAFVHRNGSMLDLGTLGGSHSSALDVQGLTVVGVADTATGIPHATRWTLTPSGALASVTDLGKLPSAPSSAALGTNAAGTIVGISGDSAFRWHGGSMVDLNAHIAPTSTWHLMRATAIDANGRIVGTGKHAGLQRAFLLVPRAASDLDADGDVDAADLALLLGGWGSGEFDSDGDDTVNAADLAIMLGAWTG